MPYQLENSAHHTRKRIMWGVILIGSGCLFLIDRLDIVQFGEIWHFWPALLVLAGLIEMLSATRFRHVTRGLFNMVLGIWLYASIENLWGWTFRNSWPILVIAIGVIVVLNGLVDIVRKSKTESSQ